MGCGVGVSQRNAEFLAPAEASSGLNSESSSVSIGISEDNKKTHSSHVTSLDSSLIIQIQNTQRNHRSTAFRRTYKGTQKYTCKDVHCSIVGRKLERTQISWSHKLWSRHTMGHSAAMKTEKLGADCAWHIVGTQ